MTTIHLIRHATNDLVETGVLAGRMEGVELNERGHLQAEALAGQSCLARVEAIYSSPLTRAMQTVAPLAEKLGLQVQVLDDLTEIDFGDWTGRHYKELEESRAWQRFNQYRSGSDPTGGESMIGVQFRMVRAIGGIRERHPEGEVVVAGHGDPLRAALCWALGVPLDLILRFNVDTASRSTIAFGEWGPLVKALNVLAE